MVRGTGCAPRSDAADAADDRDGADAARCDLDASPPTIVLCEVAGNRQCTAWAQRVAGPDSVALCIFPDGHGACARATLCRGTDPTCYCGAEPACIGNEFCVIDANGTPHCTLPCR